MQTYIDKETGYSWMFDDNNDTFADVGENVILDDRKIFVVEKIYHFPKNDNVIYILKDTKEEFHGVQKM